MATFGLFSLLLIALYMRYYKALLPTLTVWKSKSSTLLISSLAFGCHILLHGALRHPTFFRQRLCSFCDFEFSLQA